MTDVGDLIAGRYRLAGEIGRGGMGVVWRAQDELLGRAVAVKQLLVHSDAEDAVEKARREGRIAARLQHPNAVPVHDVVVHAGRPCLVMDYVAAHSFAEVIAGQGRLPVDDVVQVGAQVASALVAAHLAGIVHQDVKPDNVLIGLDGQVKITDFGLAEAIGEGSTTESGFVVGTPGFVAPEVAGGAEPGYPSDVFSLGATLYNAIEGFPPFGEHEDETVLMLRSARGEVIPPRFAGEFTPVLMSMLAADPGERPTILQVRDELAARATAHSGTVELRLRKAANEAGAVALAEAPSVPIKPVRPGDGGRPPRRSVVRSKPFLGLVVATVVTVGVLAGIFFVVSRNDAPGAGQPRPAAAGVTCLPAVVNTAPVPDGHEVTVEVWNQADRPLTGWQVRWALPAGQTVRSVTGAELAQDDSGADVRVTVASSSAIPARGSVRFEFVIGGDVQVLNGVQLRCEGAAL